MNKHSSMDNNLYKMNTTIAGKLSFFIALVSLITGCSKLKETPYSAIFNNVFYKTSSDAEAALVAAYDPLASLYLGPATIMASDFSADQSYPRIVVGRNTLTSFTYDVNYTQQKTNARIYESPQQIWISCYAGIERANLIIENVPGIPMDSARKAAIIGNGYFLRAFYHWMLSKNFGDVPVRTKSTSSVSTAIVGKSSMADLYKQVYADLDQAILDLPTYTPGIRKGEPSREAAMALYAKAALYNEDWATAEAKANLVLSANVYHLMPNVLDVYDVTKEDAARQENIWAFESESSNPGRHENMTSLTSPATASLTYGRAGAGSMFVYQSFFNSFDPADTRRKLLDTAFLNASGVIVHQKSITPICPQGVLIKKYVDPNPVVAGYSASNIPILRLPDVYLIGAEAEARQHGATQAAYDFVLPVRQRAGLANLPAGLSKDDFISAILQERSWEFFAEGDRWYDLTRTNTFLTVIPHAVNNVFPTRTPQARNRYFPIPLDEVHANPELTQNPDWQ
jgi:hypothetical protein